MAITANLGGGVKVVGTLVPGIGIQYTITLASGATAGPYTGAQLIDVGTSGTTSPSGSQVVSVTYKGKNVATSTNPADIENVPSIVPNLFSIQQYVEKNLAVEPEPTPGDPVDPADEDNELVESTDTNVPDGEDPGVDDATGIDEQTALNENALQEPPLLSDEEVDELLQNIGAEGQDVTGFEPLTEPPITNDGDEFSSIDDQVQRQKDLEDGSLEFVGIDDQTAANENALQEPPLLTDEEVDELLQNRNNDPEEIENAEPAQIDADMDPSVLAKQAALDEADRLGPDALDQAPWSTGSSKGLQGAIDNTQSQATAQDQANFQAFDDWRVRLSLAPNADYLYRAPVAGILAPLAATDGVLFPYTPVIAVTYAASYEPTTITHSNYKIFQYNSSSVDQVSITCDFTAQDTYEANYLLAVIHFFRSMTKMFYGQDENPKPGTPPPLCYLFGLGGFQFEAHPLAVTGFSYNLPNDVDYIQASSTSALAGVQVYTGTTGTSNNGRLGTQARPGGTRPPAQFQNNSAPDNPTYVPTKIQLAITCVPIISRNQISNKFSLTDYATGALLQGTKRQGGGIW